MKGHTLISPRLIYFYALTALMLPNITLCFTEGMPIAACAANVMLPLPIYAQRNFSKIHTCFLYSIPVKKGQSLFYGNILLDLHIVMFHLFVIFWNCMP